MLSFRDAIQVKLNIKEKLDKEIKEFSTYFHQNDQV